jgi:phage repressor protein C with HTH and peptisase S24 domain
MSTFGERITQLINSFGREKITENTGISQSQLYRLKSNDQDTTRKNVALIHKATGCNIQWLVTGDGPMMPGDAEPLVNEPEFTNDEIEMIALFRKAPLMLKMQTIQMLSTGQAPQGGGIVVTGNTNETAIGNITKR